MRSHGHECVAMAERRCGASRAFRRDTPRNKSSLFHEQKITHLGHRSVLLLNKILNKATEGFRVKLFISAAALMLTLNILDETSHENPCTVPHVYFEIAIN